MARRPTSAPPRWVSVCTDLASSFAGSGSLAVGVAVRVQPPRSPVAAPLRLLAAVKD